MSNYGEFPADFMFGAATAAFQVEGYPEADGAGVSNWLHFARQPGRIDNDDVPVVGSMQYLKYREDAELMKNIGLQSYRFSISWSRIFPDGDGAVNQKGVDYYHRLIDALLENGIQPWPTLFHWDLPYALEKRFGGWESSETSKRLGEYAGFIAREFSDKVTNFFTVNELLCFTDLGHKDGVFAPGLKLSNQAVNQVRHNGCLGHGYCALALKANAKQPIRVGLADNPNYCVPIWETPEHIAAARTAYRLQAAPFTTVCMEGRYPEEYLEECGADAPRFTDEELKIIGTPTDFLGINCYTPVFIMADPEAKHGYRQIAPAENHPRLNMPWLYFGPEALYWGCRFAKELWNPEAIYITENGCSAMDRRDATDGEIYDTDRMMYLRHYLAAAARTVKDDIPLKGYFLWSLLDNFEWARGFGKRFGIVYVDYTTGERVPKLSCKYYQQVIKDRAIC